MTIISPLPPASSGGRGLSVSKSLAEFAARRRQRVQIIFHRDLCVGKNSSQAASVEFQRVEKVFFDTLIKFLKL